MKPIGVFYATRQGHTQRVAEHIAASLHARGLEAEIRNLRKQTGEIVFEDYGGVMLASSVHFGIHEHEMTKFVKQHRADLEAIPSAFVSVSLTEAGLESSKATAEQRTWAAGDLQRMLDTFYERTGWHPHFVKAVAGALPYTQYNLLVRFLLKGIARRNGGDTDTSRDFVYTNWAELDRFVAEFAAAVQLTHRPCPTPSSVQA